MIAIPFSTISASFFPVTTILLPAPQPPPYTCLTLEKKLYIWREDVKLRPNTVTQCHGLWQVRYNSLNLSSFICKIGKLIIPALTASQVISWDQWEIFCEGAIHILVIDASKIVSSLC